MDPRARTLAGRAHDQDQERERAAAVREVRVPAHDDRDDDGPGRRRGAGMTEVVENPMRAWEAFYVIVGSSAGALTGLQFVVLTMISESQVIKGTEQSLAAFGSPNVVHFCAALLVSALFSAPWHGT